MYKNGSLPGQSWGRRQQSKADMYKNGSNPGQACRKMQQPKEGMRKMTATKGNHAGGWQQPKEVMHQKGSNPGQACIKMAAPGAGMQEDGCLLVSCLSFTRDWVNSKLIRRGLGNRWMKWSGMGGVSYPEKSCKTREVSEQYFA
jgi:hypothetical protein